MKLDDIIRCVGINFHHIYNSTHEEIINNYYGYKASDIYRGGIANGYVYIPYSENIEDIAIKCGTFYFFEICNVHGGVTFSRCNKGIIEHHCPYSRVLTPDEWNAKYLVIGWDTNHYDDTSEKWTYKAIIEENEKLAKQIVELINKHL